MCGRGRSGCAQPRPVSSHIVNLASSERTFSEISGCVATGSTLLVSIVVDESPACSRTDPKNLRVSAIETAIDALEDLRATAGDELSVQVELSTFARTSTPSLAGVADVEERRSVAGRSGGALPGRNVGDATDYRAALNGAKKSLDDSAEADRLCLDLQVDAVVHRRRSGRGCADRFAAKQCAGPGRGRRSPR